MNWLVEIGVVNAISATVLAVVVVMVSRWVRRPAVIHALWVLVLIKLITPPLVEIPIGMQLESTLLFSDSQNLQLASFQDATTGPIGTYGSQSPIAAPSLSGDTTHGRERPAANVRRAESQPAIRVSIWDDAKARLPMLYGWIAIIWSVGLITVFVVQSIRILWFLRFLSTSERASFEIQHQTRRLANRMGLRRAPEVWVVPETVSPMLWAMGPRVKLLFPAKLLQRMSADTRATLLAHELAHYHRGDHWIRLLELVVSTLYWWHPVVRWACREIEQAEEECCDAWVLHQFPVWPRRYAEALLDTIDFISDAGCRRPPVASGIGHAASIRRRLILIMRGVAPKSMSVATRMAILALAALLLPMGPALFHAPDNRLQAARSRASVRATPITVRSKEVDTPLARSVDLPATDLAIPPKAPSVNGLAEPPTEEESPAPGRDETRHVWAVGHSPDQQFRVEAWTDGSLQLVDMNDKATSLNDRRITSVAFSPSHALLASGGVDGSIVLWNCESGQLVRQFVGHDDQVQSVAFSPDGTQLVSGSRDGTVSIWDTNTWRVSRQLTTSSSPVSCVRFSVDGSRLAVATGSWMVAESGQVIVWTTSDWQQQAALLCKSPVGAVSFSSDKRIHVGEWNGQVTIWDVTSEDKLGVVAVKKDVISAAAFSADCHALSDIDVSGIQATPMIASAANREESQWADLLERLIPAGFEDR